MNDSNTKYYNERALADASQVPSWDPSETLAVVPIRNDRLLETQTSYLPMTLLLASTLIALLFFVRLWKNHGSLIERLFWTVFLFIPVFGPLFFLVFYPSPTELEARKWASVDSVTHLGGGGRLGH